MPFQTSCEIHSWSAILLLRNEIFAQYFHCYETKNRFTSYWKTLLSEGKASKPSASGLSAGIMSHSLAHVEPEKLQSFVI